MGSNPTLSATMVIFGEVLEWPIRRAWRARVGFPDRGFESHPLRHPQKVALYRLITVSVTQAMAVAFPDTPKNCVG